MTIKSRKHRLPARARTAQSHATATLVSSLALGGSVHATDAVSDAGGGIDMAYGASSDAGVGRSRRARGAKTLDKVEVQAESDPPYGAAEVSSPKFTRPLIDTTQTINVIGEDLFNEQGATTLTDALRNSAGVGTFYVGENGNTTSGDSVYMRGFDSSSSIFVDGARDVGSLSRDVFNTEAVEVTKGPAGTDNGRTAPTGAINMVTKRPFLQDAVSGSVTIGDQSRERITADINQTFGNGSALRLNVMAQDHGVPGRDEVENNHWGIAPSLAFGLDGDTRFVIDYLHVEQDNTPDGGVPTIGLPGYSTPDPTRPEISDAPRVDASNFYGTTSDFDNVDVDMATLRIEHDFSDTLRLQNTARWGRNRQDYLLTAFMTSQDQAARFQTPDLDDPRTWLVLRSLPTFKDNSNTILTNHFNLSGSAVSGGVEHFFSVGVELTREELETRGVAVINGSSWPAASLYDPDPSVSGLEWAPNGAHSEGRTDTIAVYVFDTIKFSDQWQVNGGVRFDSYDTEFSSIVPCGGRRGPSCGDLEPGSLVSGGDLSVDDTLFNWKLGVLYKPSAQSSVYANFAVSQQPPGGDNMQLSTRPNRPNNPAFDPQKAETAEFGAKWSLNNDRLLLSAALYDTLVSNEVVRDPVDQQYYQTGEKRVRGIELSAVGRISDTWNVSAGYTTMDTEVVSGTAVTADGSDQLTYTPDYAFTSWSTWQLTPNFSIGGGVRHSDGLKRGTDGAVGTPTYTESYWVADMVATYRVNPNLNLRLNVNNLFDEDYVAAINKSGYRYTPGQPRNGMLTAAFSF